jgi:hypothetical protein
VQQREESMARAEQALGEQSKLQESTEEVPGRHREK